MNPQEFLERARENWPQTPDSIFADCSSEDADELRALETQIAEGEYLALADIILNCHNRFQFAKTYKTLWADLRNTLSQPGSPDVPEPKKLAMKAIFDRAIRYKLGQMAYWFEFQFADASDRRQVAAGKFDNAIDIYAGKEGIKAGGCAGSVLLLLIGGLSLIGVIASFV